MYVYLTLFIHSFQKFARLHFILSCIKINGMLWNGGYGYKWFLIELGDRFLPTQYMQIWICIVRCYVTMYYWYDGYSKHAFRKKNCSLVKYNREDENFGYLFLVPKIRIQSLFTCYKMHSIGWSGWPLSWYYIDYKKICYSIRKVLDYWYRLKICTS